MVAKKTMTAAEKKKAEAAKRAKARKVERDKKLKEAGQKAKHTSALRDLTPIAKDINARFISANKMDGKADDMRLAAALRLAEAKEKCTTHGIGFKKWVEENVTEGGGWENARKLAVIGAAPEPAKALEDMRGKNKKANKKLRDGKAATGGASGGKNINVPQADAKTQAIDVLKSFKDQTGFELEGTQNAIRDLGSTFGLTMEKDYSPATPVSLMQDSFRKLKPAQKMSFVKWAALEVGAKLDFSVNGEGDASKD